MLAAVLVIGPVALTKYMEWAARVAEGIKICREGPTPEAVAEEPLEQGVRELLFFATPALFNTLLAERLPVRVTM
jgi:hypothetical protein